MPFIPHTDDDIRNMLDVIGVESIPYRVERARMLGADVVIVRSAKAVREAVVTYRLGRLRVKAQPDRIVLLK